MSWLFDVFENGTVVASGDAPDRDTAIREASHYVRMYGQDGGDVQSVVYKTGEGDDEPPRKPMDIRGT